MHPLLIIVRVYRLLFKSERTYNISETKEVNPANCWIDLYDTTKRPVAYLAII